MLVFNKKSWHYKLILYTFGENFFLDTSEIDFKAMESNYNPLTKQEDFKIIYKSKPKTVNLCPYCRAVVGSALTLPFVYIWRLFPHKPKDEETRASMLKRANRNSWIARTVGAGFNFAMAIKHIVFDGEIMIVMGIVQIGIGIMLLTGHLWLPSLVRWIILHAPKRRVKVDNSEIIKPKKEHKTLQKIAKKHDIICPPIYFVEVKPDQDLK